MYLSTKIIVTIDPVEEADIAQKYKDSPEWNVIAETTCCFVFEKSSSLIKCPAFFVDESKTCENCKHYGEDLHGANCRFCKDKEYYEPKEGDSG